MTDFEVVILAAGEGKRMRSGLPKALLPAAGRPLLAWVVAAARAIERGAPVSYRLLSHQTETAASPSASKYSTRTV